MVSTVFHSWVWCGCLTQFFPSSLFCVFAHPSLSLSSHEQSSSFANPPFCPDGIDPSRNSITIPTCATSAYPYPLPVSAHEDSNDGIDYCGCSRIDTTLRELCLPPSDGPIPITFRNYDRSTLGWEANGTGHVTGRNDKYDDHYYYCCYY